MQAAIATCPACGFSRSSMIEALEGIAITGFLAYMENYMEKWFAHDFERCYTKRS